MTTADKIESYCVSIIYLSGTLLIVSASLSLTAFAIMAIKGAFK